MIKVNNKWKFGIALAFALFMWSFSCANFVLFKVHKSSEQLMSFIMSLVCSLLIFFLGGFKVELGDRAKKIIPIAVYIISLLGAMNQSIPFYGAYYGGVYLYFINVMFYAVFAALALFITGSFRVSALSALGVSYLYNAISFIIYSFRGSPLMPTDFMAIGTAMGVASQYKFNLKYEMIAGTTLAIVHFMLAFKFPIKMDLKKKRWIVHISGLVAGVLMVLYVTNVDYSVWDVSVFSQRNANRDHGSAVGFYVNATKMGLEEKNNYSPMTVNDRLSAYDELAVDIEDKPNVIVIMNESFSDLRTVGDFKTNQEFLPYFNSLSKNVIKGTTLVSPFGGMTCNSEYEFLTGMNTGLFSSPTIPYMHIIDSKVPYSLTSHMENLGYKSLAIHPYYAKGWQRNVIYDYLGFDDFISIEDFEVLNEENEYLRKYISDRCNYRTLLNQLYSKDKDDKMFIFNITMQNHGGFDYEDFEADVLIENMNGVYPKTEQYLSCVRQSDIALQELLTELENYDEPVVVALFGDHQPAVEDEFFEELYGKSLDDITSEEQTRMYTTPFMIWANYDIKEADGVRTSPCFLSNKVMEIAGLPKSRVQMYLDDLQKDVMQLNPFGYYDNDGVWHEKEDYPELESYYDLQYSLLNGENLNYDFAIYGRAYDVIGDFVLSPKYIFKDEADAIIQDYRARHKKIAE